MIDFKDLFVSQTNLRHLSDLKSMINYVKSGGFWTPDHLQQFATQNNLTRISPIIQVSRFEDGKLFIHDGHHRGVATYLGERTYLRADEYKISDWKYENYLEINHGNGWYTPFDPRIHLRTPDFAKFKQLAREKFSENPETAIQWILEHYDLFRQDRKIHGIYTIADLSEKFKSLRISEK